jgi:flagellar basal body rod protein FlgB
MGWVFFIVHAASANATNNANSPKYMMRWVRFKAVLRRDQAHRVSQISKQGANNQNPTAYSHANERVRADSDGL